jgi:hypothetical protein
MSVPRLHPLLEERLRDATRQSRRHVFRRGLPVVITALCAVLLLLGLSAWRGWLTHTVAWTGLVALAVILAGLAVVVLLVAVAVSARPRGALAALVERVNPELLDTLNTLVYLERDPESHPAGFRRRVERQAVRALVGAEPEAIFPRRLRRGRWLVALAAALLTTAFYVRTRPWERLAMAAPEMAEGAAPGALPNLKPPDVSTAEVTKPWGEVRITEPGRDLKVTKVDVVPLQIEAAANGNLARANWLTAVGGGPKQERGLPAPREPHYAVYRPVLYLDELRLADWDVLSYYATAATREGTGYTSEIYFLEVRPFREDILKLPGGEKGQAYRFLSELSNLVDRQKHVLRQTHAFEQRTYSDPAVRKQDRDALAGEEKALETAARHLYGEIAARMENQDVGVVLDQLAKASEWLDRSAKALSKDAPAVAPEQEALTALVATRKRLQKAVSDDPNAFGEGEQGDDDKSPTAELPDKLKQIAEYRNEERAVRDALDKAAREQKAVEAEAKKGSAASPELAGREEKLARELQDLAGSHPKPFAGTEAERRAAQQALQDAAKSLREGQDRSGSQAARAGEALDALKDAVERRTGAEQLGQAYALRDALKEQSRQLGREAETPGKDGSEAAKEAASGGREASRELQRLVEEPAVGGAFGPELKKALDPARQGAREQALEEAARAADAPAASPERKGAMEAARRTLDELTGAFDKSAPEMVRKLRGEDPLKEGPGDAFARALRQLEGMANDPRGEARPAGPDDRKQRDDAVAELRRGAEALYGQDARLRKAIVDIEAALQNDKVDGAKLKQLLETIERYRVELGDRRAGGPAKPEMRHLDPDTLPAGYRERIERYFRKLSEQ